MGYTHYWTVRGGEIGAEAFRAVAADIEALAFRARVADGVETELNVRRDERGEILALTLNGVGAEAHEPFALGRGFCKTGFDGARDYDAVVCAALITLKRLLGADVSVRSDDWGAARSAGRR